MYKRSTCLEPREACLASLMEDSPELDYRKSFLLNDRDIILQVSQLDAALCCVYSLVEPEINTDLLEILPRYFGSLPRLVKRSSQMLVLAQSIPGIDWFVHY